jgi:hypothetical protein
MYKLKGVLVGEDETEWKDQSEGGPQRRVLILENCLIPGERQYTHNISKSYAI